MRRWPLHRGQTGRRRGPRLMWPVPLHLGQGPNGARYRNPPGRRGWRGRPGRDGRSWPLTHLHSWLRRRRSPCRIRRSTPAASPAAYPAACPGSLAVAVALAVDAAGEPLAVLLDGWPGSGLLLLADDGGHVLSAHPVQVQVKPLAPVRSRLRERAGGPRHFRGAGHCPVDGCRSVWYRPRHEPGGVANRGCRSVTVPGGGPWPRGDGAAGGACGAAIHRPRWRPAGSPPGQNDMGEAAASRSVWYRPRHGPG